MSIPFVGQPAYKAFKLETTLNLETTTLDT
jgi:hypothetical protein